MASSSSLRMTRGFHCSLSLRACCITLASLSMFVSLQSVSFSMLLVFGEVFHPVIFLHEDFTWEDMEDMQGVGEDTQENHDELLRRYRTLLNMALAFDVLNIILGTIDVLLTCALIYGAAKRKSAFIRPWLYVGGIVVLYNIVFAVAHTAMRMQFEYSSGNLFHIPLIVYLMLVSWNLYLDCREVESRNPASPCPVSMAALIEDDPDDPEDHEGRNDVLYSALHR